MHSYLMGEFLGTMCLITLGCGVVANVLLGKTKGQDSGWMVITTGWFIAVVIGVFVAQAANSPNADINPAVSISKYLLGIYSFAHVLRVTLAQVAGAFVGAVLVYLVYLPHWRQTESKSSKLAVFSTAPAIRNYPANMLCEVIGTAMLVFGVGAIFGTSHHHQITAGLGPYMVGILVWSIGLSLGGPTGYAINPARDLGPRLAHAVLPIPGKGASDWRYAWVPVVGPVIGAAMGAVAAMLVF